MSYLWTGAQPRNTSNGDYGRFLFTSNQASSGARAGNNQNQYYSTDGNRMTQHVHYPNCPNRLNAGNQQYLQGAAAAGGQGTQKMADYTIEYGEDAVRAALGGNMPDFQAQFQKQYGGGDGVGTVDPQAVQMMSNGKSKVAMIPVVFASEDGSNDQQDPGNGQGQGSGEPYVGKSSEAASAINSVGQGQDNKGGSQEACAAESQHPVMMEANQSTATQPLGTKPPKQENIMNAYDSVRRAKSTGQVKYGRHVRPTYWNPEINPCRKKMGGGGSGDCLPELPKQDQSNSTNLPPAMPPTMMNYQNPNPMDMMNNNVYDNYNHGPSTFPLPAPQYEQGVQPPQRARSMPPKKHIRPRNSLCGKCQKCKNLSTATDDTPVLTFPTYSPGSRRGGLPHQTSNTSSNLGQSAKNFRAIRFSSNKI